MMQNFSDFIANYRDGSLNDILTRELTKLTEAVENLSRKGTINITIELKPAGIGKMDVAATYSAKPPVNNTVAGLMFVDDDKQLVADDPHQPMLDLKIVAAESPKTNLKAI